jgi:peptidyl-tRNA hydrolase, PTH2 family
MKQVIVVNEALRLPCGKLAAQVAHAAVAVLLAADPDHVEAWLAAGMPKIVLQVNNEAELLAVYERAKDKQIPAELIRDAGKTVVAAGTITCLGLGPAPREEIDSVTGSLKLLP